MRDEAVPNTGETYQKMSTKRAREKRVHQRYVRVMVR